MVGKGCLVTPDGPAGLLPCDVIDAAIAAQGDAALTQGSHPGITAARTHHSTTATNSSTGRVIHDA
jgi:hypothetical protein